MDWASDDYSRVYADTFLTPAHDSGAGIYLLDETDDHDISREARGSPRACRSRDMPRRSYGPKRSRLHEGYYTGGNIISDRNINRAVHGVAWDERLYSGADWDRLIPPHTAHRGPAPFPLRGPAPFPLRGEIANIPGGTHRPSAPSAEYFSGPGSHCGGGHCSGDCGRATELKLQYLKVFLLIVVVVLLAMTLAAAGRLSRSLEKTVRSAVGALGAVAVGGRSV
jgi:hypothetical protein